MFAAFTTGRQRSISAAMCVPRASGGASTAAPPSFSNRAFTSAEASALLISSFSRAVTFGSMPAGPVTPYHWSASKPGTPDSATVGSSGKASERFALETASARRRPCLASGMTTGAPVKPIWSWPARRSATKGAVPL